MSQTHLHAVRHGRGGDEPLRPDGIRSTTARRGAALRVVGAWLLLGWAGVSAPALASAQPGAGTEQIIARLDSTPIVVPTLPHFEVPRAIPAFRSTADSLAYETTRAAAERSREFRIIVSLTDRELYVLDGADTMLVAPVAVAVDTTLEYNGRSWRFETPRGRRTILSKVANPYWTPPEWHYAEVAARQGLKLAYLRNGRSVPLSDGRELAMRGGKAGLIDASGFHALPTDEEIVFDGTIFVPPEGSANRRIEGELGKYKLSLGDGFLLHGTPHTDSIGQAATHGCVRLLDEDVQWLYDQVPVGTPVYIY